MNTRLLKVAGLALLVAACSQESEPASTPAASLATQATVDQALEAAGVADEVETSIYEKSIAVLPFSDLSENNDQEYFSDGLSQDLINRLAMMSDLQVAGSQSSFYYKGRDEVLGAIGDALQVQNILLGSVRKSGDNLRITAQLVNADNGFNIWSRTYDRELADVFAIQNEIVDEVVSALSVTLGAGELDVPGMTHNIEAYDKSLQARALYGQFTPDSVLDAINLLKEAVFLDPEYGQAWVQLGAMHDESQHILSQDQAVDFPVQVARFFAQAAEIAPDMPELMLVEAGSLRDQGRFLEAENRYQHYFESYGYSVAHAMEEYGHMLARTGQFNEAIAMFKRAQRTEPFAPRFTYQVAMHELIRGEDTQVMQLAEYGQGLEGGDLLFHSLEWELAMRRGNLKEAAELIKTYFNTISNGSTTSSHDTNVSRHFMEKFADILERNDFDDSADDIVSMINDPSVTPQELGYVARLVALMGQPEIALDYWFGVEASPAIWDRVYDDMRRLPDFNQLLQEKGMVDYWRDTGNWGDFCVAAGGRDFVCQ